MSDYAMSSDYIECRPEPLSADDANLSAPDKDADSVDAGIDEFFADAAGSAAGPAGCIEPVDNARTRHVTAPQLDADDDSLLIATDGPAVGQSRVNDNAEAAAALAAFSSAFEARRRNRRTEFEATPDRLRSAIGQAVGGAAHVAVLAAGSV